MPADSVEMRKFGAILVTRARGREIAGALPPGNVVRVNFAGVQVASPSFLDELVQVSLANGITLMFENITAGMKDALNQLDDLRSGRTERVS